MHIKRREGFIIPLFVFIISIFYLFMPAFRVTDGDFGEVPLTFYHYTFSSLGQGEIPLWNPRLWGGVPSLGHTIFQAIYPINLFLFLLIKNWSYGAFFVLDYIFHISILCIGLYFLQRLHDITIPASFISALVVVFSYEMLWQNSVWVYLFTGFAWLPLIVDFIILFERNDEPKKAWIYVLCAGISLGFSGLANQGQTLLINILVVCFLYLCLVCTRFTKKYFWKLTGKMLSFGILGIMLCAPALLPALEFSSNCSRHVPGALLEATEKMPLNAFVEFDSSFASIGSLLQFPTVNVDTNYYIWGSFGVMVSICGVAGFFAKTDKSQRAMNIFIKGCFFFIICYSTGFVLPYIFYYIPFYNAIREPFLYIPFLVLPLAFMVGKGLDLVAGRLYSIKMIKEYVEHPVCMCGLLLICFIGLVLPYNFDQKNLFILILVICAYFSSIVLKKYRILSKYIAWILIFIAFFAQLAVNFRQSSVGSTYEGIDTRIEQLMDENIVINSIIDQPEKDARYYGFGEKTWTSNSLLLSELSDAAGYVNPISRSARLATTASIDRRAILSNIKYWYTSTNIESTYYQKMQEINAKYLGEVSVIPTYGADEREEFAVWQADTLGLAWLVNDTVEIDDLDTLSSQQVTDLLNSESINFQNQAYVAHPENVLNVEPGNNKWEIETLEYKNNSIKLSITTEKAAVLATSEIWYPGWKVYVDGSKQELLQVNCCYRGCGVPAGTHTIEFVYKPGSLYLGIFLCILGTVSWFLVFFLMHKPVPGKINIKVDN